MDRLEKQSYEEFTISTDFSRNMSDIESLSSYSVTATDNSGGDASTIVLNQATISSEGASKVKILVRAGTEALSPYKLTFKCITNLGHRWEYDLQLKIKEI
jgi:hypothetical protein